MKRFKSSVRSMSFICRSEKCKKLEKKNSMIVILM